MSKTEFGLKTKICGDFRVIGTRTLQDTERIDVLLQNKGGEVLELPLMAVDKKDACQRGVMVAMTTLDGSPPELNTLYVKV